MIVYFICYGAGMLFAASAHSYLSGFCLMAAALWLYLEDYRKSGNPLHLRGLFSLFWVGGEGVSCLKLSRLQTAWRMETWAAFFVAFTAFWAVYQFCENWMEKNADGRIVGTKTRVTADKAAGESAASRKAAYGKGFFEVMLIITAVSLAAFILEAAVLGYVPFLVRGVPHAYSYFHITGVHYFTVSCVLVPSMSVLLFYFEPHLSRKKLGIAVFADIIALAIPILCVSRFQLIFAVILAVLTFMLVSGKKKLRYPVIAVAALIPLYIVLTIARSHDVAYLNGIFEMKNPGTPIFITQPYMYIANNYDNFNCLVEQLPRHTLGVKGMFPLWALTGLKFIKPELAAFPLYTTKEELTTVTLFYDAYYDFGIVGVFLFSSALGAAAAWLTGRVKRAKNPAWHLFYAQAAIYFILSFFTTWYSNPTTWFYFAATGAAAVYASLRAGTLKIGGFGAGQQKRKTEK